MRFVLAISVLDLYLSQLATRHRKKVGAIEKVEEQCLALNQINSTLVLFALNQTLKEQEDVRLGKLFVITLIFIGGKLFIKNCSL